MALRLPYQARKRIRPEILHAVANIHTKPKRVDIMKRDILQKGSLRKYSIFKKTLFKKSVLKGSRYEAR